MWGKLINECSQAIIEMTSKDSFFGSLNTDGFWKDTDIAASVLSSSVSMTISNQGKDWFPPAILIDNTVNEKKKSK